ncbi:MAG TPA: hypothetical protein VF331_26085 [Polyangiales bacterium]
MLRGPSRLVCVLLAVLAGLPWASRGLAEDGGASERHARHRSLTENLDCSACHSPTGWSQLTAQPTEGHFDHARTGFPLTGQHAKVACTSCHGGERRLTRDCAGCHTDTHQRKLGLLCDSCHSSVSWNAVRAIEIHRNTLLPLTGMHALADCTQCHQRASEKQWSGVPADCYACHARDYRRKDIHPLHVGGAGTPASAPLPRDCAQCHVPTAWQPAFVPSGGLRLGSVSGGLASEQAPAGHDLAFPISFGPHRGLGCADCHRSDTIARALRCTGCHSHDPLALRAQHKTTKQPVRDGSCLSCHPGGAAR